MGRLTQTARELRKKQALVSPRVHWMTDGPDMVDPAVAARCTVGVTFFTDLGDGTLRCFAKDGSGLTIEILPGCVTTPPARADYAVAARRLLDEAGAARKEATRKSIAALRSQLEARGIDPSAVTRAKQSLPSPAAGAPSVGAEAEPAAHNETGRSEPANTQES